MELVTADTRNQMMASFSTPNLSSSVYNATTYKPIVHPRRDYNFPWLQDRSQRSIETEDEMQLRPFNNLPPRDPVDLQFKDIAYFVNHGFRRGRSDCPARSTIDNYYESLDENDNL